MSEFEKTEILASDLEDGSMKTIRISSGEDVLVVNSNGKRYGMGAICTHETWDLSEGILDGTHVTCAGHASVWDLETGKADFTEDLKDLSLYDVKIQDGHIWIRTR